MHEPKWDIGKILVIDISRQRIVVKESALDEDNGRIKYLVHYCTSSLRDSKCPVWVYENSLRLETAEEIIAVQDTAKHIERYKFPKRALSPD